MATDYLMDNVNWGNPPIDKMVTVAFEYYTEAGKPYQPRVEQVHEDE